MSICELRLCTTLLYICFNYAQLICQSNIQCSQCSKHLPTFILHNFHFCYPFLQIFHFFFRMALNSLRLPLSSILTAASGFLFVLHSHLSLISSPTVSLQDPPWPLHSVYYVLCVFVVRSSFRNLLKNCTKFIPTGFLGRH